MKIERINDNQIKCTLNRSDLASHQVKISELAYGTEKTKGLFQDMMDQAYTEFGFDASDNPLMIEAIPVSMDCIVLMITKVDNPDEVDTDFSSFSNLSDLLSNAGAPSRTAAPFSFSNPSLTEAEDSESPESLSAEATKPVTKSGAKHSAPTERIFSFSDITTVIDFAHRCGSSFPGESSLYKCSENGKFYVVLKNKARTLNDFGRICNIALEFGSKEPGGFARSAYLKEHFETIIAEEAISTLCEL